MCVADFCDYFSTIEDLVNGLNDGEILFYRGLPNDEYDPIPSFLVRNDPNQQSESDLYHSLLLERPEDFNTKNHLSTLAKMQHYTSKTRLMDVSTNPLMAFFFASAYCEDKDGAVVVYRVPKNQVLHSNSDKALMLSCLPPLKEEDKEEIKRFCLGRRGETIYEKDVQGNRAMIHLLHEIRGEYPAFECGIEPDDLLSSYFVLANKDNERSKIQSGYFVIAGLVDEQQFKQQMSQYMECKIIIPSQEKARAKKQLEILNVNESVIYPSLDRTALNIRDRMWQITNK